MKNWNKQFGIVIFMIFICGSNLFAMKIYERVIAVVNESAIVESEVNEKFVRVQRTKKISKRKVALEKSKILDKFIEDAIVYQRATREAILINDKKVYVHLEKVMSGFFAPKTKDKKELENLILDLSKLLEKKINNKKLGDDKKLIGQLNGFIRFIKKQQKMNIFEYFNEIKLQIRRDQLMSVAIGTSPPSKKEVKKWYGKNKKKIGYEVNVKHLLVKPKNGSLSEERRVSKLMSKLRKRITKGESFEKLAREFSQDPGSASKGGDLGWVMLAELDPYFAGNVFKMRRKGQISQVFKSGFGYHIVKYFGKRPVSFQRVERMITYKLYNEKMIKQFKKWIAARRKASDVKIYMKDYIKPKKVS